MTTKIKLSGWSPARVVAMVTEAASEHLHAVGEFVVAEAQAKAPVLSGTLRDNITYRVEREGKGYVCWVGVKRPAFHAAIVELGSSGHTLKAKKGAQAPSVTNTQDWFGKPENVQHPGTRAQPYLRPAVWDNAKTIVKIFETGKK